MLSITTALGKTWAGVLEVSHSSGEANHAVLLTIAARGAKNYSADRATLTGGVVATAFQMTEPIEQSMVRSIATPPHLIDPSGSVAVYWTEPPGAVVQLQQSSRGTTSMAEWLVGHALDQLIARYPDETELCVVLDMRQMLGRSATARALLLQASSKAAGRIASVVLLPSTHMGVAYIKVIEATALLLRLSGYQVHIEDDLEVALAKFGIRIPSLSGVHPVQRR